MKGVRTETVDRAAKGITGKVAFKYKREGREGARKRSGIRLFQAEKIALRQ